MKKTLRSMLGSTLLLGALALPLGCASQKQYASKPTPQMEQILVDDSGKPYSATREVTDNLISQAMIGALDKDEKDKLYTATTESSLGRSFYQVFKDADVDGDKKITSQEMHNLLVKKGYTTDIPIRDKNPQRVTFSDIKTVYEIDLDSMNYVWPLAFEGVISREEFKKNLSGDGRPLRENMVNLVHLADINEDGVIDPQEFVAVRHFIEQGGYHPTSKAFFGYSK